MDLFFVLFTPILSGGVKQMFLDGVNYGLYYFPISNCAGWEDKFTLTKSGAPYPIQHLPPPEAYSLASEGRVYGTAEQSALQIAL